MLWTLETPAAAPRSQIWFVLEDDGIIEGEGELEDDGADLGREDAD